MIRDINNEHRTIRSQRQGGRSSPAAMAASALAWRADWRKPAPRSPSSDATKRSRSRRSPSSNSSGVKAISVTADVTDKAAVADMVARTLRELGRIDILVNNAGINIRKPPHALDIEEWDSVIRTNLTSAFLCSQAVYPAMKASGRRQDHQHRLDDVDLRRQLRARLRREQGRHRAVHALLRGAPGPPTTSRPTRCCRAGSTPI